MSKNLLIAPGHWQSVRLSRDKTGPDFSGTWDHLKSQASLLGYPMSGISPNVGVEDWLKLWIAFKAIHIKSFLLEKTPVLRQKTDKSKVNSQRDLLFANFRIKIRGFSELCRQGRAQSSRPIWNRFSPGPTPSWSSRRPWRSWIRWSGKSLTLTATTYDPSPMLPL